SGAALVTQPALSSAFTDTPPIQTEFISARSLTPNRVFYPAGVAPRWRPETLQRKSPSSGLSPLASRPRRRCAHHVRRQSIQWRDWLPTTRSSIPLVSAANTATPNSALAPSPPFKESFTASPTSSSSSKAKETMTRGLDASSTKSCGPPRRQII
ncbi:hypothetical protein OJAV_G00082110, partial [Oryzias javanicus]